MILLGRTRLIGQPVNDNVDVGLAVYKGKSVIIDVFSGSSALAPGHETGSTAIVDRILFPLTSSEAGTIRCIGLNVNFSSNIH